MKVKFFTLIFFFLIPNFISAKENKLIEKFKGCNYIVNQKNIQKIGEMPIKLIEVDTHDYRKWTVNSIRILTNRFRFVNEKYKDRYDATISVTYLDDTKCIFDGRIRHSGDEKDHIAMLNNSISQSIDVHLKNGNIRGITKFKLLRSNTRGVLEDEIFLNEILRNLNFIAPRTEKVKARVNKVTTTMIFQEKAAKEMLEYNKRREGPILEGDERFFRKLVEKFEDNNLSNWSAGVVPLLNKSSKYMLSKQINANIIKKSEGHKRMSLNASSYLNLIYLYFANRFQDTQNNFNYFEYDLENTLLGMFNEKKISLLNEYNLVMLATNSEHGLAINNRKFYWNSIENYFEPINYDANADISKNITKGSIRLPITKNFYNSVVSLENRLNSINIELVKDNLNFSGLEYTKKNVETKLAKILKNLDDIKYNYENYLKVNMLKHNNFKEIENILDILNNNLKNSHPNTFLIKFDEENDFQRCEIFLENCVKENYSVDTISNLLEGELKIDNALLQYVGMDFKIKEFFKKDHFKKIKLDDFKVFYEEGIELKIDEISKIIDIRQIQSGSKIYIIDGILNDYTINFNGFNSKENKVINQPKNFPSDFRGLTGCLSLINLKFKNLNLKSTNSTCEDSINFINSSGIVENIYIENAYSDALDVDFSELEINNIYVHSAKNDCLDFSYGKYMIKKSNLSNCGDKALSVGENSKLNLDYIQASISEIGIASKDSSIVNFREGEFNSVKTCLSAYKKKQEFEGGVINYNNMKCNFTLSKIDFDSRSIIRN